MLKKIKLTNISKFLMGFTLLIGSSLHAQSYPSKPITLLIPYPPGGSAGMLALPMVDELQKKLGQPVILVYRPGAGGTVATAQVARANPDGYTLVMILAAHAVNPELYPSLPYDTRKDFSPVSLLATLPLLVAAPLSTPANNIQELVKYATSNPDKLTYASAGNGNTSHLAVEKFKTETSTKIRHIPYKGSAPAVVAMLSDEVSFMFDSISTSLPHVKSGKLKALAVTGEKRSPLLPNVPTVLESGIMNYVVNGWYGVIAPAGTPKPIIDKLSLAFSEAAKNPRISKQLAESGYEMIGSTPDVFGKHIENELILWKKVVQDSGAKIE